VKDEKHYYLELWLNGEFLNEIRLKPGDAVSLEIKEVGAPLAEDE
jgi:hypothetical protein